MAHAIAARTRLSIPKPLRPGVSGVAGGRGCERGALTEGAVVSIVTVTAVAELPADTGFGKTAQVVSEGAPLQPNVTLWL